MANPTVNNQVPQGNNSQQVIAQNKQTREFLKSRAINRVQIVNTQTVATPNSNGNNIVNIVPRNVGIIKRFLLKLTATVTNNDGALALTLSDFGLANFLQQLQFTDLNNNIRIQTTGIHLANLAAVKYQWPLGQVVNVLYQGSNYNNTFGVISAPSQIAHGATGTVTMWFEIPLAYSDDDLRGALFANVLQATMNLQLTLPTNAQAFTAAGVDSTFAMYKGTANATLTNVGITLYQEYLDQIPMGNNGQPIYPQLDLATIYELKATALTSVVQGQDFPIAYANQRDFLSTMVIYDNNTTADGNRLGGTDINYWALQSANFTNLFKVNPDYNALQSRKLLITDFPPGFYYFSHRNKPIATQQYGNMQLILNPSTAAASATAYVMWEAFGLVNNLMLGGSLAAN